MKKFSKSISEKESTIDFESNRKNKLSTSNDIEDLQDDMNDFFNGTKLDGEWVIDSIIDVTKNDPNLNEAIIINAEIGTKSIKRGDVIYITAMIHKKDSDPYNQTQMGVIKVRITDIYNNLFILNSVK